MQNDLPQDIPATQGENSGEDTHSYRHLLFFFFLGLLLVYHAPVLVSQAQAADATMHETVPTTGDDGGYQVRAVNFLYGKGYSYNMVLPLRIYNLDLTTSAGQSIVNYYVEKGRMVSSTGPDGFKSEAFVDLYRSYGFPMHLVVAYIIGGNNTLAARYMLAICVWGTAFVLLLMGYKLSRFDATLAGGMAGLIYLQFYILKEGDSLIAILTEKPTTFWVTLMSFFFMMYSTRRKQRYLLLAGLSIVVAIYIRPNLVFLLPGLVFYLFVFKYQWQHIRNFCILVAAIVGVGVLQVSLAVESPTLLATTSSFVFAQTNNIQVLEGVGPDHYYQGYWSPGFQYNTEDGTIVQDNHFSISDDRESWKMGVTFWKDHVTRLPELAFYKMREGFWTDNSILSTLYILGIGFLLLALGLRKPRTSAWLRHLPLKSSHVFFVQWGLILVATQYGDRTNHDAAIRLSVYLALFVIAFLRPYGDVYQLDFPSPTWALTFVATHLFVTVVFTGVRYHEPFDPILIFMGLFGSLILLHIVILRAVKLAASPSTLQFGKQLLSPSFRRAGVVIGILISLILLWNIALRFVVIRNVVALPLVDSLGLESVPFNLNSLTAYEYQLYHDLHPYPQRIFNPVIFEDDEVASFGLSVQASDLDGEAYRYAWQWFALPYPGTLEKAGFNYLIYSQVWFSTQTADNQAILANPDFYRLVQTWAEGTKSHFLYEVVSDYVPGVEVYNVPDVLKIFEEGDGALQIYRIVNDQGVFLLRLEPWQLPESDVRLPAADGWTVQLEPEDDLTYRLLIYDERRILVDEDYKFSIEDKR